jgi:DNA-binding NarL/FixJ family response regulator
VLDLLAAGRSNDAIAREICHSGTTGRNVASSIYGKLHAADRAEAITAARGRSAAGPGGRPTDR